MKIKIRKKIDLKQLFFKRPTCKNCNTYSWTITIMLLGLFFMVWAYQHDTGYERVLECNKAYKELSAHLNLVNPPYQLMEGQIADGFPGFLEEPMDNFDRDENIWCVDITDASEVIRFKNEVFVESELE